MALPDFDLKLPTTLTEALTLAGQGAPGVVLMAGGTDVMLQLKQGVLAPATVVSLSRVREILGVRESDGGISIGGGTTVASIAASELLRDRLPGLVEAARSMATAQIRHRATVAGNLATAAACADLSPILHALGARLRLQTATAQRVVPLSAFFRGPRVTVLAPGEILVSVEVSPDGPTTGSAYVKFGYRRGAQIAVASAGARVTIENGKVRDISVVLGAVAPTPLPVEGARLLVGERPEGAPLAAVCEAAARECRPISDLRGSAAYRRAVVAVVTRKAILAALVRACGTSREAHA